jgi:hypothetical protein
MTFSYFGAENSQFPIPNSQFPIPNSRFPIPDSYFAIPNSQFPIPTVYRPFVGAGALFFDLQPTNAIICDKNDVLITTYRVIRDEIDELIRLLNSTPYSTMPHTTIKSAPSTNHLIMPACQRWSKLHG